MFSEAHLSWLTLEMTDGLGPRRIWRAVERFGSAEAAAKASARELEQAGIPESSADAVATGASRKKAEAELKLVEEAGGRILTAVDEDFPARLKQIFDPPVVLWTRGDTSVLRRPGLAIVGTRTPTAYGAGMAEMLSRDLSMTGLVILSGMARGVDSLAHAGALDAGGKTVAVWGTGIDVIYPKENKKLAERILSEGGTIISEFPMGTFPAAANFPIRNRTLSGMSVGVLVVEAGEQSGSRITARLALEQNREVFAVPGNVTNKQAWGPNTLIKQGAKLVATWEDVWEDLPTDVKVAVTAESGGESPEAGAASLFEQVHLPPMEEMVYALLRKDEALQLDEIIDGVEGRMSSSEVFAALFELELKARVRQSPGKNYVKTF